MMEMHSFLTAKQMDIPSPDCEENISVRDLFEFLYQISEWIQTSPWAYRHGGVETSTVYFEFYKVRVRISQFRVSFC